MQLTAPGDSGAPQLNLVFCGRQRRLSELMPSGNVVRELFLT